MAKQVARGTYRQYDGVGENVNDAAEKAWRQVWADQKNQTLRRAFTRDYESTVPREYTKDGKDHCYLFIAVD